MRFVPPFRVEPPIGDRVVWTRRIVDAEGQALGMLSGAPESFTEFLVESLNENAYDPEVLADIEAAEARARLVCYRCDQEITDPEYLAEVQGSRHINACPLPESVHPDGGWRAAVEA